MFRKDRMGRRGGGRKEGREEGRKEGRKEIFIWQSITYNMVFTVQ